MHRRNGGPHAQAARPWIGRGSYRSGEEKCDPYPGPPPEAVRLTGVRGWATEVGRESKRATVRLCTTSPRPVGSEPYATRCVHKGQQQPLEPKHDHLLIAGHRTVR